MEATTAQLLLRLTLHREGSSTGCSLPDDLPGDEAVLESHLARNGWPLCCRCPRGGGYV